MTTTRVIADDDVDEKSFTIGMLVGVFAGLLLGVLFGVLRWRTQAVQVEECKRALHEVARFHESCALELGYEREHPVCPAPVPRQLVGLNGGRQ